MLRILIIDESRARAEELCGGLAMAGHQVAAVLPSALDLTAQIEAIKPDVILIETESPSRDTLENLAVMNRDMPRPVILLTQESDAAVMRAAFKAGVSAYIVDNLDLARLKPIVDVATEAGFDVVRGSESDVVARFVAALDAYPSEHVVRLTADCPLTDPLLVEAVVATHLARHADYTSNVLPRSFPKGLDVEVMRADVLRIAADEAAAADEREHVTPFVYRRPERFRLTNHDSGRALGREWWTVDTPADLDRVRAMVDRVGDDRCSWTAMLAAVGCRNPAGRGDLALRPAGAGDADALLRWRNASDAVQWSTTARAVDPTEHRAWFERILVDAGRRLWIGVVDGLPVGMVRVDVETGIGTVSVAVDPERRGHGVGSGLLRAVKGELLGDCQVVELRALVHPANPGSARIFGRSGFTEMGLDDESGFVVWRCDRSTFGA